MKRVISFFFFVFLSIFSFANEIKLLVDGKQAFPQIIECIRSSEKSIYINMFIWRDDSIGNIIAQELINAADRGVKIEVSKDTYGTVCEHAEESGVSFFHKKVSFIDRIKIATLKLMYNPKRLKQKDVITDIYQSFMNHPNIFVKTEFKADHSKYYIFDEKRMICGGINIEDKENGKDYSGREYQDYMIFLDGSDYVDLFRKEKTEGATLEIQKYPVFFGMNLKTEHHKDFSHFQMEQLYLDIINNAEKEVTIVMAYFTPRKQFLEAISNAVSRGVKVTIVFPQKANFQDDSNKATAERIWKLTQGKVNIYFSPKMLHTKLVYSEKIISFGSCNITKKAFGQLDELNCFIKRNDSSTETLEKDLIASVQRTIEESCVCVSKKQFKRNRFISFCEQLLM